MSRLAAIALAALITSDFIEDGGATSSTQSNNGTDQSVACCFGVTLKRVSPQAESPTR